MFRPRLIQLIVVSNKRPESDPSRRLGVERVLRIDRHSLSTGQILKSQLFSLVAMFNLMSFWVRDNGISSVSEHRNLFYIRITNYSLSCLQLALWRMLSVCRVLLWCLLHTMISVKRPGHQRDRKKSENSISVCKTLLLSLTSTIVFSIINRMSLNC